jgi:hypothetical protein
LCKQIKAESKACEKQIKAESKACEKQLMKKMLVDEKNEMVRQAKQLYIDQGWIYCYDDNSAIDILLGRMQSSFVYSNGVKFYKDGNIWICDDEYRLALMKRFILESKICTSTDKQIFVQYSSSVSKMKLLMDGLDSKLCIETKDDNFQARFHTSTKNKLCFRDGVLDFAEKKFALWSDVPEDTIYTTILIDRDYAEYFKSPDASFVKNIRSDILEKVFDSKTDLVLKFLARSITGNIEDKNFMSYSGNRDCGKGILYELAKSAFGSYVGKFDLDNMMCKRDSNKSSDTAKENAWLLPLEFTRLAIAQETDENENCDIKSESKISNRMMKTVMSGGDTLTARQLFKNPRNFTIDATLMFMGNNELSISGDDSAQHHLKCNGVRQFITQEQYDCKKKQYDEEYMSAYAVRSETLKMEVRTDKYTNAFVWLLYTSYVGKAINIHHVVDVDGGEGAAAEGDDDAVELSVRDLIFLHYRVTKNDKDKITKEDVFQLIQKDKKKITAELKELGCFDNNSKIFVDEIDNNGIVKKDNNGIAKKVQVRAFKCLVLRPPPPPPPPPPSPHILELIL